MAQLNNPLKSKDLRGFCFLLFLDETEAVASKRILAFELQQSMKEQHMTKTTMAKRMHTSRSAVERLFDPENESVTLSTLNRAASALGRRLKVELV